MDNSRKLTEKEPKAKTRDIPKAKHRDHSPENKSRTKNKLIFESVIGFTDIENKLHGVIKFRNGKIKTLPHKIVREKFPQGLIDFYEKNLIWN